MGGTAAAISKTAAAPIERVKLMIQNQGAMLSAGRLDRPYGGITDCFKRTYADEGLRSCEFLIERHQRNLDILWRDSNTLEGGTSKRR